MAAYKVYYTVMNTRCIKVEAESFSQAEKIAYAEAKKLHPEWHKVDVKQVICVEGKY